MTTLICVVWLLLVGTFGFLWCALPGGLAGGGSESGAWRHMLACAELALRRNVYILISEPARSPFWGPAAVRRFRELWPGLAVVALDGCAWQPRGPYFRRPLRMLVSAPWAGFLARPCSGQHAHVAVQPVGSDESLGRAGGVAYGEWLRAAPATA